VFVCESQDSITLKPVVTGDDGSVVYQWYNLGGAVIGNDSLLTIQIPTDTTYYIVGIVSGGCTAVDTAMVAPGQIPDVDAGIGQSIVKGQSMAIGGSPTTSWGGSTFVWRPGETLSDSTASNPIATPTETTLYTVFVTNILGCTNSDTILIQVSKKLAVVSGFTPNGDGSNDVWELDFIEKYPSTTVSVYNRWGDLVFKSKDGYPEPWDGTFEGAPLPIGTYYYVIDLKDGDFPEPVSGPVTIVR
jgi:gliding motility-associated-like protein